MARVLYTSCCVVGPKQFRCGHSSEDRSKAKLILVESYKAFSCIQQSYTSWKALTLPVFIVEFISSVKAGKPLRLSFIMKHKTKLWSHILSARLLIADCCISPRQNTKDSLQRSLQWVDSDLIRVSSRQEWPALLHNLCMLHSLIRLRTRYGLTGWNKPLDLRNFGTAELWVSITALKGTQSAGAHAH